MSIQILKMVGGFKFFIYLFIQKQISCKPKGKIAIREL